MGEEVGEDGTGEGAAAFAPEKEGHFYAGGESFGLVDCVIFEGGWGEVALWELLVLVV